MKKAVFILRVLIFSFLSSTTLVFAQTAYITNNGDNSVSVIDTDTNTLITTITQAEGLFNSPSRLAITPNGSTLYVKNSNDDSVSVINTSTNKLIKVIDYAPSTLQNLSVSPDGLEVYIAIAGTHQISVVSTVSNTEIDTIPLGVAPGSVAFARNAPKAYIGLINDGMDIYNTVTRSLITNLNPPNFFADPGNLVVSLDDTRVYAGNLRAYNSANIGSISVVNATSNTELTSFSSIPENLSQPVGMALTPSGKSIYVTNIGDDTVFIIDTTTNQITHTISQSEGQFDLPFGIAITADGTKVYVANRGSSTISIINLENNTLLNTISQAEGLFNDPQFIVFVPENQPVEIFLQDYLKHSRLKFSPGLQFN
ncbi:MAG: hypothetical protein S4CHLAM37_01060 [Chlamydiia bacterium]|nr:hypothetical protein [Chlamydiia bacterium]